MTQRTKAGSKSSKTGGMPEQTQKVIAVVLIVAVVGFVAFMAKVMGFWPGLDGGRPAEKRLVLTPQQIQKLRGETLARAQANGMLPSGPQSGKPESR